MRSGMEDGRDREAHDPEDQAEVRGWRVYFRRPERLVTVASCSSGAAASFGADA